MKLKVEDYIEKSIKLSSRESFTKKFNCFVVELADPENPSYKFQFLDSENPIYDKIKDAFNSLSNKDNLDILSKNILLNHNAIDLYGADSTTASIIIDETLQNLYNCCNELRNRLNEAIENVILDKDNNEYIVDIRNLISYLDEYSSLNNNLNNSNIKFGSKRRLDIGFDGCFALAQKMEIIEKSIIEKKYFKILDSGFPLLIGVILENYYVKMKELNVENVYLNQSLGNIRKTANTLSVTSKKNLYNEYLKKDSDIKMKKIYYDNLRDALIERLSIDKGFSFSDKEKIELYNYFNSNYKNRNMKENTEYTHVK